MAKYKSGMRFKFEIEYNNGSPPQTIITDIRDILQWERNHDGKSFVADDPAIDQLLWIGWAHAKRTGMTNLRYEAWTDTIDDFDSDQADKPGTNGVSDDGEPIDEPVPTEQVVGVGV